MRLYQIKSYLDILMSNKVDIDSFAWREMVRHFEAGRAFAPIVLLCTMLNGRRRQIILDGNHRALILAVAGINSFAYEVTSKTDVDVLLNLEAESAIPRFPHRDFLKSEITIETLRDQAIWAAGREAGFCSVQEAAARIALHTSIQKGTHFNAPRMLQSVKLESDRTIDNRRQLNAPGLQICPIENQSLSAMALRAVKEYYKSLPSEDVVQWGAKLRDHFHLASGSEFACSFGQFAQICGLAPSKGNTVASKLINARIIDCLGVRLVPAGGVYTSGKPIMNKINFWRFI